MDDCPVTPRALDQCEGLRTPSPSSRSRRPQPEMDGAAAQATSGGDSPRPEDACSICLGCIENKSHTDKCAHNFCFTCLLEWSKVNNVCPQCRTAFKAIIHTITSENDYKTHRLPERPPPPPRPANDIEVIADYVLPAVAAADEDAAAARRLWMDDQAAMAAAAAVAAGENAVAAHRMLQNSHMLNINEFQEMMYLNPFVTLDALRERVRSMRDRLPVAPHPPPPPPAPRQQAGRSRAERRRLASSDFRASIYDQNVYIQPDSVMDVAGRFRESNPEWYRNNPAQTHRLVPWLNRELNALRVAPHQVPHVLQEVLDLVERYPIQSPEFQRRMEPWLSLRTTHFQHEFFNFARSVYDMVGYDRVAQYGPPPRPPAPEPAAAAPPIPAVETFVVSSESEEEVPVPVAAAAAAGSESQPSTSSGGGNNATGNGSASAAAAAATAEPIEIQSSEEDDEIEFVEKVKVQKKTPEIIELTSSPERGGARRGRRGRGEGTTAAVAATCPSPTPGPSEAGPAHLERKGKGKGKKSSSQNTATDSSDSIIPGKGSRTQNVEGEEPVDVISELNSWERRLSAATTKETKQRRVKKSSTLKAAITDSNSEESGFVNPRISRDELPTAKKRRRITRPSVSSASESENGDRRIAAPPSIKVRKDLVEPAAAGAEDESFENWDTAEQFFESSYFKGEEKEKNSKKSFKHNKRRTRNPSSGSDSSYTQDQHRAAVTHKGKGKGKNSDDRKRDKKPREASAANQRRLSRDEAANQKEDSVIVEQSAMAIGELDKQRDKKRRRRKHRVREFSSSDSDSSGSSVVNDAVHFKGKGKGKGSSQRSSAKSAAAVIEDEQKRKPRRRRSKKSSKRRLSCSSETSPDSRHADKKRGIKRDSKSRSRDQKLRSSSSPADYKVIPGSSLDDRNSSHRLKICIKVPPESKSGKKKKKAQRAKRAAKRTSTWSDSSSSSECETAVANSRRNSITTAANNSSVLWTENSLVNEDSNRPLSKSSKYGTKDASDASSDSGEPLSLKRRPGKKSGKGRGSGKRLMIKGCDEEEVDAWHETRRVVSIVNGVEEEEEEEEDKPLSRFRRLSGSTTRNKAVGGPLPLESLGLLDDDDPAAQPGPSSSSRRRVVMMTSPSRRTMTSSLPIDEQEDKQKRKKKQKRSKVSKRKVDQTDDEEEEEEEDLRLTLNRKRAKTTLNTDDQEQLLQQEQQQRMDNSFRI